MNIPQKKKLFDELQLKKALFDGCRVGLRAPEGSPMKKGWTCATDDQYLHDALDDLRCKHPKDFVHTTVEGKLTKSTELYSKELVDVIHSAWKESCSQRAKARAVAATPTIHD